MIDLTKGPIFLFSAGWRSGSTLVQRLLSSTGEVMMWGEPFGALDKLRDADQCLALAAATPTKVSLNSELAGSGAKQFQEFVSSGCDPAKTWIANVAPPEASVKHAFAELFTGLYGVESSRLGYSRWGIKEVRSDAEVARWLYSIFPNSKFVFLIRDPRDTILSIKRRNWLGRKSGFATALYFARHWSALASSFLSADFGYLLRYEDLIADPEAELSKLGRYLSMPNLNPEFIGKSRIDWSQMNSESLSFLDTIIINQVTASVRKRLNYL